jgi:hypothetical protein
MTTTESVHWNLRAKCWSVRKGRARVKHTPDYALDDVAFRVSEAGRQRVLKEKQRNVHAFARGRPGCPESQPDEHAVRVRYNPYEAPTFTEAETGRPVLRAKHAAFRTDGTVWVTGPKEN